VVGWRVLLAQVRDDKVEGGEVNDLSEVKLVQ